MQSTDRDFDWSVAAAGDQLDLDVGGREHVRPGVPERLGVGDAHVSLQRQSQGRHG